MWGWGGWGVIIVFLLSTCFGKFDRNFCLLNLCESAQISFIKETKLEGNKGNNTKLFQCIVKTHLTLFLSCLTKLDSNFITY